MQVKGITATDLILQETTEHDLERSREFYEEVLGLKVARATEGDISYDCGGGTSLYVYQRPEFPAAHTEAAFKVDDIVKKVEVLREKGVVFEEHDSPG